ncbi:winged helix-turn-helix transcriptional regulator [Nocardioides cavernae]|uniref:Winged helix-turn-helix transcriptional regulator n=1 Tax=Nocardioides cavernae TaxID=1921566 RepID=A0ABR8N666_9ACTN|nr:metalloregulator ArsR/SmtB family transcription factor [Nocardioides cavernae]MBD3923041.1 winged helix-turn-helix transcriptional regulator [Nocardioides cavernae]MBM7512039.1 DNA-binding transcriptional ArsR family regulator [Nocardioides cavernae]
MDPFAALADPVRRDLVARLARGPARVVDLTAEHAISRPAISRHLRLLAEAGLVTAEDRGRERHYRLERTGLSVLADWLAALDPHLRFDESVLDGLDLEVRRTTRDRARDIRAAADARPDPQEETA